MTYLFGSGWWTVWYALLWLAIIPYVVMAGLLVRASRTEPTVPLEKAFAVGAVGLAILMIGTAASGYMWTAGTPVAGWWLWVRNVGASVLASLLLGLFGVFGSGFYVALPKQPMHKRWFAQFLCLASAGLMLAFCLHATWRFRHR